MADQHIELEEPDGGRFEGYTSSVGRREHMREIQRHRITVA
jgi:hypothetical protein